MRALVARSQSSSAPIDFSRLDGFVREFQAAGVEDVVICLRSRSKWASKKYALIGNQNISPKPEFLDAYGQWIAAVVERYDADGNDDAPGLYHSIRFYEIGTEFSSYEPEPVEEYLTILERAYAAAHRANDNVIVAHAPFLTTLAFANHPSPDQYEAAFKAVPDKTHNLTDIRQVLDRPDLFDVINVHALGEPSEIESIVAWLDYEMAQRGYRKGIIISDTATTPFIGWGPATICDRPAGQMGKIVPPATEADRCRLADYFTKLVEGDVDTLRWTQAFAAQDTVKKVVISAEQGILLINTAFTEDLFWLKLPIAQAGAGTSAWAGLVDVARREYRPGFFALQQLIKHLDGYESISRIDLGDEGMRVYEITHAAQRSWIAWYDPGYLILTGDPVPEVVVELPFPFTRALLARIAIEAGQPEPETFYAAGGMLSLSISPAPIFVQPAP